MAKPRYSTPGEMQRAIDLYFEDCEGVYLTDPGGQLVLDPMGCPVVIGQHPPTMTGLAMALGFRTRKSLCDYRRKGAFQYTVMRARLRVENYAEQRLYDSDGVKGAMFGLVQNFGWGAEQQENPEKVYRAVQIISSNAGVT